MAKFLYIFVLMIVGLFSASFSDSQKILQEAELIYKEAAKASTPAERAFFLNQALSQYNQVNPKTLNSTNLGWYWNNLGNIYYELSEYPWAILYYERSLNLLPREQSIKENLDHARAKLSIPVKEERFSFSSLLEKIALREFLQFFGVFIILSFIFISLIIWSRQKILMNFVYFTLLISLFLGLAAIFRHYGTPLTGIVVHDSLLQRGPGQNYLAVNLEPILSGSKVYVIEVTSSGDWMKVRNGGGNVGYMDAHHLKLVMSDE